MDDIFSKYNTARSLHKELTNILLLCMNDSNYYYCYCDGNKRCSLCEFCDYFPDVKIKNMSCEKFLQVNHNKKDKLDMVVKLIKPFFNRVKTEKKDAVEFFYKEYYWYRRNICNGDIDYVTLDEIVESNKNGS